MSQVKPILSAQFSRHVNAQSDHDIDRTTLSPHPTLPPIKNQTPINQKISTPHLHNKHQDTDSFPSSVCQECQFKLVNAFDHCLSKNNTSQPQKIIRSVYEIDEEADATPIHPPPYFEIVEDPSDQKNAIFTASEEQLGREKWVAQQAKKKPIHT